MSTSAFSRRCELTPEQQAERTAGTSTQTAPAGWFGDPLGRFDGRFFDGDQWTDQVSENGVLRLDTSWATSSPLSSAGPENDVVDTERRGSYDRRQIKIQVDVERRKGNRRDG